MNKVWSNSFIVLLALLLCASCSKSSSSVSTVDHQDAMKVEKLAYEIEAQKKSMLIDSMERFLPGEYQKVPFVSYKNFSGNAKLYVKPDDKLSKLSVEGDWYEFSRQGVVLDFFDAEDGRYKAVFKEALTDALYIISFSKDGEQESEVEIVSPENSNLLYRGGAYSEHLYLVLYDNVVEFNFLYVYSKDGNLERKVKLPSVLDPAGTHYEMIPAFNLFPYGDGIAISAGAFAGIYIKNSLEQLRLPPKCWRVLEMIVHKGNLVALCQMVNKEGKYSLFDLVSSSSLGEIDGVPWGMRSDEGGLKWNTVRTSEELKDLFLFDFIRVKNNGVLNYSSNNIEGRIPWSQIYYLNGLLDILYLSTRSDKAFDIFYPLASQIKQRIDLEIYFLDNLLMDMGMASRGFTVNRELRTFAVQTSRVLMLFERYLHEVSNPIAIKSYPKFKDKVLRLDGHIEVAATTGEGERWLTPGYRYLMWPKKSAFYFDGVNVPYNHQNEWANAVFDSAGAKGNDLEYLDMAKEIIKHFLRHVVSDEGRFPREGVWPYWWGTAYDGWNESEGISTHIPTYGGDQSLAWISFKSIDVVAVLSAQPFLTSEIDKDVEDSALQLVHKGHVYPFVTRKLNDLGRFPTLSQDNAFEYVRANSPWELSNTPWSYMEVLPLVQVAE